MLIEFRDFSFSYWEAFAPALRDVNLHIDEGEFVLVAGPSGCGKTSLCRCLNGLIPHFHGGRLAGNVTVAGLDVAATQPRELASFVGMVFQDPENQVIAADVERDVAFGLENSGMPVEQIAARVEEVLNLMGIADLRTRLVSSLSGGEKQRVAIAAALAVQPRVLVLDEPSSELDVEGASDLLNCLRDLRSRLGITIVLVEHRLERVIEYIDRVVLLERGRIVADGPPRTVLDSMASPEDTIGLPPVVRLARELRSRGLWQGVTPLSVEEASVAFRPLLDTLVEGHRQPRSVGPSSALVSVDRVCYSYDDTRDALNSVSMVATGGGILAIMGKNASGKTTLAKHLNGLLRPRSGIVKVLEADIAGCPVAALSRRVGMVFQNPNDHLFAETVDEEILFTLRHLGFDRQLAMDRLEEVLGLFELLPYRARYPRSLSGGERQRVALASVVAARPPVLMLDEPTRGMEYARKLRLMRFLEDYARNGNLVILVSHDVETCASHADSVLVMESGTVRRFGAARPVLASTDPFVPQIGRMLAEVHGSSDEAYMIVEDCLEALS